MTCDATFVVAVSLAYFPFCVIFLPRCCRQHRFVLRDGLRVIPRRVRRVLRSRPRWGRSGCSRVSAIVRSVAANRGGCIFFELKFCLDISPGAGVPDLVGDSDFSLLRNSHADLPSGWGRSVSSLKCQIQLPYDPANSTHGYLSQRSKHAQSCSGNRGGNNRCP